VAARKKTADAEAKETPFTVTEISDLIRSTLEEQFASVWVEGEISKAATPASGHLYITLKDDNAALDAVIWRGVASKLKFDPEEGMKVLVRGRVSTYAPYGRYQMILDAIEPAGVGALQIKFEQLKKKLEAKGYFDDARKKEIPPFPKSIGVVTSGTGAAFHDIVKNIRNRDHGVRIILCPVLVEGAQSAEGIAGAIDLFNRYGKVDVLIVGRGGGSPESLWGFNEEVVADAIFRSKIPVISAVGHEVDFTIADFVADMRSPTPSSAAVHAVKDRADLLNTVDNFSARLLTAMRGEVREYRARVGDLASRTIFRDPTRFLEPGRRRVDENLLRITSAVKRNRLDIQNRVVAFKRQLDALRPDRMLKVKRENFAVLERRLAVGMGSYLKGKLRGFEVVGGKLPGVSPVRMLRQKSERVDHLLELLESRVRKSSTGKLERLRTTAGKLDTLSPLKVLERGYSIAMQKDGQVIRKKADVKTGDEIEVLLERNNDGTDDKLNCKVI
jgi:exodeoxyribonuclease VII large subunit